MKSRIVPVMDPEKCARCGTNAVREQHPEDRVDEIAAKSEAAANIDAFFDRNRNKFKALVQTYADGRAEMLLEELREQFWSTTPVGATDD